MIKVNESMLGRSHFIDYMLYLFQVTSEETYPTVLHVPTPEFNDYIEILYKRSNQPLPEIIVDVDIPKIEIQDDPNKVVLAFSGGKDSVAHAAFLKDYTMNPILYYVKGVNRSYPNERNVAIDISEMLHCSLLKTMFSFQERLQKLNHQ